jgi:hypothetical protein
MEPVASALGVTAAQIWADWRDRGHPVSRQYVNKLLKKGIKGATLPTTSLDEAWLFRTQRTVISKLSGGVGRSGVSPVAAATATGTAVPVKPSATQAMDSLDEMLRRVADAELLAFQRWQERLTAKEYDAIAAETAERAWKSAARTRTEVEARVAAQKKSGGLAVDLADAQLRIDERLSPLRSAVHGLDREMAKALFPDDPAKWRPVIRSVLVRIMLPAFAIAKRRLRPAAPDHGISRAAA